MKSRQTTHQFLHKEGLKLLNNDMKNIKQHLNSETKIQKNDIEKMKKNLKILVKNRNIYIDNASVPDKKENKWCFEKYIFIKNYGMITKK